VPLERPFPSDIYNLRHRIGLDHRLTVDPKPTGTDCKPQVGTIEVSSTSFGVSTNPTTTTTTSTSVTSTSFVYTACEATDSATSTKTTSTAACTLAPTGAPVKRETSSLWSWPWAPTREVQPRQEEPLVNRINFECERPSDKTYVILVSDEENANFTSIKELLDKRKEQNGRDYRAVGVDDETYFFYGYKMHDEVAKLFEELDAV